MMRALLALGIAAAAALLCASTGQAAERGDLRDLRVGMPIAEIPAGEYADLACADAPTHRLADWAAFGECPAGAQDLRAVAFRFDERSNPLARVNDAYEGTKVGGHPVRLTLVIEPDGVVAALRIDTDPEARLFWRKKAHLLADLVKIRYGEEGWTCRDLAPGDGETAVGGVFIKQHCDKTADGRSLSLDEALYRRAGQPLTDFVNEAHLEIRRTAPHD
jgi:hypothetical protein